MNQRDWNFTKASENKKKRLMDKMAFTVLKPEYGFIRGIGNIWRLIYSHKLSVKCGM